jgi:hypothetical protein
MNWRKEEEKKEKEERYIRWRSIFSSLVRNLPTLV